MTETTSREPIQIDIWSDIACPWCYIGKRNLEAGLTDASSDEDAPAVNVIFHSYELAPDTPVDFEGTEAEFLAGHRGMDTAQADEMLERVTGVAAQSGLTYNFDALQHTNTVKAHELLHYAQEHGAQAATIERLMAAYFTQGRHVGHIDELVEIAADAGLDADDVRSALEDERYLPAVRADEERAATLGINAVPFFVFDNKYGVSGAQPAAAFAQILRQVWAEHAPATTVSAAD